MILNERLNVYNHIRIGYKQSHGLITRLCHKAYLISKLKYQLTIPQLKVIVNSIFESIFKYGIQLWCKVHPSLTRKIDDIRINTIRTILGRDYYDHSNNQLLKSMNWNTTPNTAEILRIIQIQKTLFLRYPVDHYIEFTNGLSFNDISQKKIISFHNDPFNSIPLQLKNLKPHIFRKKYKTFLYSSSNNIHHSNV